MARPAFSHVPVMPRFSGPQGAQHQISTLAHVSGVGGDSPRGLRPSPHGVWDLPRGGTGTSSDHWPSFETGAAEASWSGGRRGRLGAAAKRRALWGLWLRPRPGSLPRGAHPPAFRRGCPPRAETWGTSQGRAGGRKETDTGRLQRGRPCPGPVSL